VKSEFGKIDRFGWLIANKNKKTLWRWQIIGCSLFTIHFKFVPLHTIKKKFVNRKYLNCRLLW